MKPTQLTVFVKDSVFVFLDLEVHLDLFDLLRCLREGGHHWLDAEHVLDVLGVAPGSRCQNCLAVLTSHGRSPGLCSLQYMSDAKFSCSLYLFIIL